jgi:hypothetical protein
VRARRAIDLEEIARPKIPEAGRVERNHLRAHVLCSFVREQHGVEPGRQPANRLLICPGMQLELPDAERDVLARFLRSAIDVDRYPLSTRLVPLKAILTKLDPKPPVQSLPPPKAETPSRVTARKRR